MGPIVVMENEYVTVWYHPDSKVVHHRLTKNPDSAMFRAMLSRGAECLEEHHATKWLSDDTNLIVVRDHDSEWGETVWGPRVLRAGFKWWAIVAPASAIGQLTLGRIGTHYRAVGVTVSMFTNVDAGLEWLASVGPVDAVELRCPRQRLSLSVDRRSD